MVSAHLCTMTFGFPNSKKNSFHGNYMRKYGILSFSLWQKCILLKMGQKLVKPRKNKFSAKKPFYQCTYNVQCTYNQLGFSSEIEVPQLGSARLELENSGSGSSLY